MATTPTAPTFTGKLLKKRIKNQIPQPKQHKWTQIGAKALGGDKGALSRLTKRGLISEGMTPPGTPAGSKPKAPSTPKPSSTTTGPTLTGYRPPAITDVALEAASPKPGVTPGTRHDVITGLDVKADYGPNPYNPGGATAAATAKPKDPDIASQPPARRKKIKQLGKALQKARDQGDKKKAKRLHWHIKRLRKLHSGESLPRPTPKSLQSEREIAQASGNRKWFESVKAEQQRLREKNVAQRKEAAQANKEKNGIADQTKKKKKSNGKAKTKAKA